jgi:murein DD-endopeptidase MepM/ murein hydrolase activator NlpD
MRLRRTLALAAVAAGLSVALPALAYSGPRLLAAVPIAAGAHQAQTGQPSSPPHDPVRTWTWPLAPPPGARRPVVVHPFQPPAKRWQAGHRGVDLLGGPGQEVLAAGQGTVSYAGTLFGRPVVAIDHTAPGRDTLRTTYEPVDPVVKVGDKVRSGQLIGHLVDSPANHCAPRTCLHWGLVRGFGHAARYLNPAGLLERGPVRLLPVWGVR